MKQNRELKSEETLDTNFTYGMIEEIYTIAGRRRVSYGIAAFADARNTDTATLAVSVHDLTADKDKLAELVALCNRLELSPTHLQDVIGDFFA